MGFDLSSLFEQLEYLLSVEGFDDATLLQLRQLVARQKTYAKDCGKL